MFNLFRATKKIPAGLQERLELIRQLVQLRFDHDPVVRESLRTAGLTLDDYDDELLVCTCEASLMRIVEQFIINRELGHGPATIIQYLNHTHAELWKQSGQYLPIMSEPYCLTRYIHHVMIYMHNSGVEVTPSFFPIGIRKVYSFYGRER